MRVFRGPSWSYLGNVSQNKCPPRDLFYAPSTNLLGPFVGIGGGGGQGGGKREKEEEERDASFELSREET